MNNQSHAHIEISGRTYRGIFIKDFGFVVRVETASEILNIPRAKLEAALFEYGEEFSFPTHAVFMDANDTLYHVASLSAMANTPPQLWLTIRGITRLVMVTAGDLPSPELVKAFNYPIL